MKTQVMTAILEGLQATLTTVTVQSTGTPKTRNAEIDLLGWKNGDPSKKRIEQALTAAGVDTGPHRLEARGESGSQLSEDNELAVAIAVAAHAGRVPQRVIETTMFAGGLAEDGKLRPAVGMVALARAAVRKEVRLAGPARQSSEAAHGGPVRTVLEDELGKLIPALQDPDAERELAPPTWHGEDVVEALAGEAFGDEQKERVAIAAAGHHHVRLGERTIDLALCLPGLLGPPGEREQEEIATIHSVAGVGVPTRRPLRYPHWTVTGAAMSGSDGRKRLAQAERAQPGEISLAHNGVLVIELGHMWSQDVMDRVVHAAAQGFTKDGLPGHLLIAGIGSPRSEIEAALEQHLDLDASNAETEKSDPNPKAWARKMMRRIRTAQAAQDSRYGERRRNGTVSGDKVRALARVTTSGQKALERHATSERHELQLTRIARTLADLKENETVTEPRVVEASRMAFQKT